MTEKRVDYSHCPPKKRPIFQPYELDDNQPQDLSMKKPPVEKQESPDSRVNSQPPNCPRACISSSTGHISELEPTDLSLPKPALPPIDQNVENSSSIADFYLHLFKSSATPAPPPQACTTAPWGNFIFPFLPPTAPRHPQDIRSRSPLSGGDIQLSSPRSTSSDDSGVATLSEDEVDVVSCSEMQSSSYGEKVHTCRVCRKSYSTLSGLSRHRQFHCHTAPVIKPFGCKHCDKVYTTLGALKMHIRTHTLPCKCHLCGKAFSRPWLLQGHIRTHTGEKPFQCQQCERSFADRSNLRAHLQTHAEVKKYSCTQCHKTFSRISLLNKHQEGACPAHRLRKLSSV